MALDSWLDTRHCRAGGCPALGAGMQVGPADPSGGQRRAPGPAASDSTDTHDVAHPWLTGAQDTRVHNHTAHQGVLKPVRSSALPTGPHPGPHLCIHPGVPASGKCSTHLSLTVHLAGSELSQGLSWPQKGKTGEGIGNPLQCSCLENPRDGRAWWAAIYGVTESDMTDAT